MREIRERLVALMRRSHLDMKALSKVMDELPPTAGGEAPVVVQQVRRAMAAVAKGDHRFKPFLRHAVARLIVLLEDMQ